MEKDQKISDGLPVDLDFEISIRGKEAVVCVGWCMYMTDVTFNDGRHIRLEDWRQVEGPDKEINPEILDSLLFELAEKIRRL